MFKAIKKLFSKVGDSTPTPDEPLVPVIMPPLSAILTSAEDKKGSPLTIDEVNDIRDKAPAIMLPQSAQRAMVESRGYEDIDPNNVWYDWQMLRREMGRVQDIDPGIRRSFTNNDDPAYRATISNAQNSLNEFSALVQALPHATHMLKTVIIDGEERSNLWLHYIGAIEEGFVATPFEVPTSFKSVKVGSEITLAIPDVLDWMIIDEGSAHGGYSIRFLRNQKPEREKKKFDEFMGIQTYMPLPETSAP